MRRAHQSAPALYHHELYELAAPAHRQPPGGRNPQERRTAAPGTGSVSASPRPLLELAPRPRSSMSLQTGHAVAGPPPPLYVAGP